MSSILRYLSTQKRFFIDLIDFSKPKKNPILIGCIENKLTNIAKVFIKNNKGLTNKNFMFLLPINVASSMNNIELVKLILEKNDDISYGGLDNEYLPLNIAINNELFDLFDILKNHVKNYNLIDKYKNSYLHYMSDKLNYYTINNQKEYEKKTRHNILEFIKKSEWPDISGKGGSLWRNRRKFWSFVSSAIRLAEMGPKEFRGAP